jgi:hypothetical protein
MLVLERDVSTLSSLYDLWYPQSLDVTKRRWNCMRINLRLIRSGWPSKMSQKEKYGLFWELLIIAVRHGIGSAAVFDPGFLD